MARALVNRAELIKLLITEGVSVDRAPALADKIIAGLGKIDTVASA